MLHGVILVWDPWTEISGLENPSSTYHDLWIPCFSFLDDPFFASWKIFKAIVRNLWTEMYVRGFREPVRQAENLKIRLSLMSLRNEVSMNCLWIKKLFQEGFQNLKFRLVLFADHNLKPFLQEISDFANMLREVFRDFLESAHAKQEPMQFMTSLLWIQGL